MSTYRTGNHWGVTIVREGARPDVRPQPNGTEQPGEHWNARLIREAAERRMRGETDDGDQLVAVVVNGDQALAERICALLNGDDPARALLEDLADPNPCWYDHHGYCQAHGWMATEPRCPNARVKELLDGESR